MTSTSRPGGLAQSLDFAGQVVDARVFHGASVRVRETTTFSVTSGQRPTSRVLGSVLSSR